MTTKTKDATNVTGLSCKECSEDIPYAAESEDYVAHFCGLSCYKEWKDKHRIDDKEEKTFVYKGIYTKSLNSES